MKFYSTNHNTPNVNLHQAVFQGTAPDKGLYMPEYIPRFSASFFSRLHEMSLHRIAFEVSKVFFGDDFSDEDLRVIIEDALNFDIPLVNIHNRIFSLELFNGPTLAFKDVGARFMARVCQQMIDIKNHRTLTILVATSGDTGSAVANGFLDINGINVVVLYPKGRVSDIQEKQFTTLGKNIIALEVEGSFDDCQQLVKDAFADENLRKKLLISSANSINLARLLPQCFYFFYGLAQLKKWSSDLSNIVFCVPSGNFGNLTAGLIAKRMGLPIRHFIAATNINDVVPIYLQTKKFKPKPSVTTLTNAMDVGNPGNFSRILDMYNGNHQKIKNDIKSDVYTDDDVMMCIKKVYEDYRYLLDPHGAIGYLATKKYVDVHKTSIGIFIETAHPAKFLSTVEKAIGQHIKIPPALSSFLKRQKKSIVMKNNYQDLKAFLLAI